MTQTDGTADTSDFARRDTTRDPVPHEQLVRARRGQDYFAQKLDELSDADFEGPSLLPGWTRRHVVAHVGLNARALMNLTTWAATGVETPMYQSSTQHNDDIRSAATLPTQALRDLAERAAAELHNAWRDLQPEAWSYEVRTARGRRIPVSETIWMRTREAFIHAVDLDHGATFADFPAEVVDRLLVDVLAAWDTRREAESLPSFVLQPADRTEPLTSGDPAGALILSGTAAHLAAWATGRGRNGISVSAGEVPGAPHWL